MYEVDYEALMRDVNKVSAMIDKAYMIIHPIPKRPEEYGKWERCWNHFRKLKVCRELSASVGSLSGITSRFPNHKNDADKVFDAVYEAVFYKDVKKYDFETNKKAFMQEHSAEIKDFVKYVLKTGNFIIPTFYMDLYEVSPCDQLQEHEDIVEEQLKILKSEISHIDDTRELIERIDYINSVMRTISLEAMPMIF